MVQLFHLVHYFQQLELHFITILIIIISYVEEQLKNQLVFNYLLVLNYINIIEMIELLEAIIFWSAFGGATMSLTFLHVITKMDIALFIVAILYANLPMEDIS